MGGIAGRSRGGRDIQTAERHGPSRDEECQEKSRYDESAPPAAAPDHARPLRLRPPEGPRKNQSSSTMSAIAVP